MSQFAAPRPPTTHKSHATLELVPEADVLPDDDFDAHAHSAYDADATPPPTVFASPFAPPPPPSLHRSVDTLPEIPTTRHARARSVIIGVVAASIGLLAMALAFRPWQWTHAGTRSASATHAPAAVTLAKRSMPPMPRTKSFATAKNTKPATAAARQPATHAKPAVTPTKPAATHAKPTRASAAKTAAPHKPAAAPRKPGAAPAKTTAKRPAPKP